MSSILSNVLAILGCASRHSFGKVSRAAILRLEPLDDKCVPATITWQGPSLGNWSTAANWSTGAVPGANDDVVFDGAVADTTSRNTTVTQVKSITIKSNYTKIVDILIDTTVTDSLTMNGSGGINTGTTPNKLILPNATTSFSWTQGGIWLPVNFGSSTARPTGTISGTGLKTTNPATSIGIWGTITWTGTGDIQYIGDPGAGNVLAVKSGGTFNVQTDADFTLGTDASSIVTIMVEQGGNLLKNAGTGTTTVNWRFSNSGFFEMNTGTMEFTNVATNTGTVEGARTRLNGGSLKDTTTDGYVISSGLLDGVGTITGHVSNGGTLHPGVGNTYGTLTISGNYTNSGTLRIEVTNNANEYGKLVVTGDVTLGGTVNFANMSVTTLTSGTMTFLTYASLTGDFTSKTYDKLTWNVGGTIYKIQVNAPGATAYTFSIVQN